MDWQKGRLDGFMQTRRERCEFRKMIKAQFSHCLQGSRHCGFIFASDKALTIKATGGKQIEGKKALAARASAEDEKEYGQSQVQLRRGPQLQQTHWRLEGRG